MPKTMRRYTAARRYIVVALMISALLPARAAGAHWEFHDGGGGYLFGYAGVEENLEPYLDEIEANRIPTNAHTHGQ